MSKIFNELKSNFSQLPNDLINDESISRDARFLFILLAAQSEDFKLNQKWILKMMGWKDRKTLTKYWSELQQRGWGARVRRRISGGRLGVYDYHLFSNPSLEKVRSLVGDLTSGGFIHSGSDPQWPASIVDKTRTLNNTNSSNNTNSNNKKKEGKALFVPPEVKEIGHYLYAYMINHNDKAYVKLINNGTIKYWAVQLAKDISSYYEATNWRNGRGRKVKDWKLTASGWAMRALKSGDLFKLPLNHPDFGKKPWEIESENKTSAPSDFVSPLKSKGTNIPGANRVAKKAS